jgi:hypothetical protein
LIVRASGLTRSAGVGAVSRGGSLHEGYARTLVHSLLFVAEKSLPLTVRDPRHDGQRG